MTRFFCSRFAQLEGTKISDKDCHVKTQTMTDCQQCNIKFNNRRRTSRVNNIYDKKYSLIK